MNLHFEISSSINLYNLQFGTENPIWDINSFKLSILWDIQSRNAITIQRKKLGLSFHFEISDSIELSGAEITRVACTYNNLQYDKYAHTNHNKDSTNTNIVHIHHTHKWTWRKDPVGHYMILTHQGPGIGASRRVSPRTSPVSRGTFVPRAYGAPRVCATGM